MPLDLQDTLSSELQPIFDFLVKKQKIQAGLDAIYGALLKTLLSLILKLLCDKTLLIDQFLQKLRPWFR